MLFWAGLLILIVRVGLSLAVFVVLESGCVELFCERYVLSVLFFRPLFFLVSLDEEVVAGFVFLLSQRRELGFDCEQAVEQGQLWFIFVCDWSEEVHFVLARVFFVRRVFYLRVWFF